MTFGEYLKGETRVSVTGLNMARFLNETGEKYGTIKNLERVSHKEVRFTLEKKACEKLLSETDEMCYTIEVIGEAGLPNRVRRILSRAGLLFGLIAAIAVVAVYNLFLWDIEVVSEDPEVRAAAEAILRKNSVRVGRVLSGLDLTALRIEIETEIDKVASANVTVHGVQLKVVLNEVVEPLPDIVEGDGYNIAARYDCRIESIAAIAGTPLVKKGDFVKAGDIIVAGRKLDESGPSPVTVYLKAQAEVTGTVWFTDYQVFSPIVMQTVRTGRTKESRNITMFGRVQNGKRPKSLFETYQTETFKSVISRNTFVPIILERTVYYETETVEVASDFETERPRLEEETMRDALAKVPEGLKIERSYHNISPFAEHTKVEAVVEVRTKVGYRTE